MSLEPLPPNVVEGAALSLERLLYPWALLDERGTIIGLAEGFPASPRGGPGGVGADISAWLTPEQRGVVRPFLQGTRHVHATNPGQGTAGLTAAAGHLDLALAKGGATLRFVPLRRANDAAVALVIYLEFPQRKQARGSAERELQHRLRLSALLEAEQVLSSTLERDVILQRIVDLVREVVVVPEVVLFLLDAKSQILIPVVAKVDDYYDEVMALRVPVGQGIVGHVAKTGNAEVVNHAENDPRSIQVPGTPVEATSLLTVPLFIKETLSGVLTLTRFGDDDFTSDELEVVTIFASQCSVAIENSRLYTDLQETVVELRSTQEQLIQSAKLNALGEMASGVAHDFNNVLTAILGRTQLLLRWVQNPELRESLRVIERTALDGAQTVRRIQEFTRVRHDQGVEVVDVNAVVRDVIELTRPSWEYPTDVQGHRVTATFDLRATRPVRGRAAELREVLTNLVLNALDAMPKGGDIRFSTKDDGDTVVIRASDTGVGMDEETRARIFDPFFTTKLDKGTGLGLSVAYGIVTRHGGHIEVESEPGGGTTFLLRFPISTEESVAEPSRSFEGDLATMRVLCVDDEKAVLEVMAELLEALGQEVEMAHGGEAGVAALRRSPPEIVFTDLGMPGTNGWEVAGEAKRHSPGTAVVMVTGWGVQLEPDAARERGVDYILPKPYTLEEVNAILADIAKRRKAA